VIVSFEIDSFGIDNSIIFQVVAFLRHLKVNGNATCDETTMLTIIVKHLFNIKSKAVLRIAILD
jgi:hypothetical protein